MNKASDQKFAIRGGQRIRSVDSDGLADVAGVEVDFMQLSRDASTALEFIDDRDFVEVEIEGGLKIAMTGAELRTSEWFEFRAFRDDGVTELFLKADRTRGGGGGLIRKLKAWFFSKAEDRLRGLVLDEVEGLLCPKPGFFLVQRDLELVEADSVSSAKDDVPLILLHGTFSSTLSSFGAWLANPQESERIWRGYKRVFALNHRTLEETPVANALQVIERLDKGAEIDLVGFSRGGLIGELLAQNALNAKPLSEVITRLKSDSVDADQFALRDQVIEQFQALHKKLLEKQIKVRRFVRVGCPARGTRLASRERLRNVLALVRFGTEALNTAARYVPSTVVQSVTNTLKGLAHLTEGVVLNVINPNVVPGLYAMDPRRHVIRHLINHEELSSSAELANVGANTVRSGINLGRAADFALDLYFGRANDWVVDTDSMNGGAKRPKVVQYLIRSERTHTQYFADPSFAQIITDGLVTPQFDDLTRLRYAVGKVEQSELRQVRSGGNTSGPVLLVLPGIMGSQLAAGGDKLWLAALKYASGGFKQLRIDKADVIANGFVGKVYGEFCDAFRDTHEVIPFPYDWRHSVVDAGRALNAKLKELLARIDINKRPIQIVAHSMGGLVVRAMLSETDSVWSGALKHPDSRIIMLGTPNQGSHAITAMLSGQEDLMQKLAMADLTEPLSHHVGLVAKFPGILDMLPAPTDEDSRDYFDRAQWDAALQPLGAAWPRAAVSELKAAKARRTQLSAPDLLSKRVHYIAGQAPETPCKLVAENGKVSMLMTELGDGRVLWETGIPLGVPLWYAPRVRHGDLPGATSVQRACADILRTGATDALPRSRPERMKPGWFSWLRDGEAVSGSISQAEFEQLALGGDWAIPPADARSVSGLTRLDVAVSWGDLKDAEHPLFVGHYQGDGIFGAERSVDEIFDKRLTDVHRSGLYPGAIGTQRVLYHRTEAGTVRSAIVVGLGEIGSLSATALQRAIREGLIAYATRTAEQSSLQPRDQPLVSAGLSFLLIGSTSGTLNVREVGRCILQGVSDARKAIANEPYRLDELREIEFIELYQDVAHTLWYQLEEILDGADPLAEQYRLDVAIRSKRDGRKRVRIDDQNQWWQPLKIEKRGEMLLFTNLASKARAEVSTVKVDKIIAELIDAQVRSPLRRKATEFALFELLVPGLLKDLAPESADLRLLLTPGAAAYPWEMLTDRLQSNAEQEPQAVRVGMVRQLSAMQFRNKPLLATNQRALIIVDPKSSLVELPGAQLEGAHVHRVLEAKGWEVNPSLRDKPGEIIIKHFGDGHEIVHYCGHGVDDVRRYANGFEHPLPVSDPEHAVSGMVLGEGIFLTAELLESLRELPKLAFVNCCHLGAIKDKPHAVAAHFAEKLVLMGVPCVIAAGWAVDDQTAACFAEAFYGAFLTGVSFGESVKRARKAAYEHNPQSTTFAAYQCYGDPSFSLARESEKTRWKPPSRIPSEAALIAEVLPRITDVQTLMMVAEQVEQEEQAKHLQSALACEALAAAFERLGDLESAVAWYGKAIAKSDNMNSVHLKSFTPWVNLQSRVLLQKFHYKQIKATEAHKTIDALLETVSKLLNIPVFETSERYGLLGATLRRKALIEKESAAPTLSAALVAYETHLKLLTGKSDAKLKISASLRIAFTARALALAHGYKKSEAANTTAVQALKDAKTAYTALKKAKPAKSANDWDYFMQAQIEVVQVYVSDIATSNAAQDLLAEELSKVSNRANRMAILEQIVFMETFLTTAQQATSKWFKALLEKIK